MSEQDRNRTEALWESFAERLRAWFRRRGASAEEAEDLLQETFLRIHAGLDVVRAGERLAAWIWTIARNLWTDRLRRAAPDAPGVGGGAGDGAESGAKPAELPEPADEGEDDPDAANRTVAGWLEGFVADLPDAYREAVRLSELEGVPQAEVARRLGLSVSGAKSRVQRGRAALRSRLVACCAFELDRRGGVVDWSRRGDSCCET
jgi:RNA polymerase sigma-70 factor (ECF subfamily)